MFAILTDIQKRRLGIDVYVHAILLPKEEGPSIVTHIYNMNQPEEIRNNELKSFLEKHIPENHEVYACDGYHPKYAPILEELKDKFMIKTIDDAHDDIQGQILEYFAKIRHEASKVKRIV